MNYAVLIITTILSVIGSFIIGLVMGMKLKKRKKKDSINDDYEEVVEKLFIEEKYLREFYEKLDLARNNKEKVYNYSFWVFIKKLFPDHFGTYEGYIFKVNINNALRPFITCTKKVKKEGKIG